MKLRALQRIKHDGVRYEKNDLLHVEDTKLAQRLINLRAAVAEGVSESSHTHFPSMNDQIESENIESDDELTDQEVADLLDKHFKPDVLTDDAKELGLEFAGNIGKKKLIELIIQNELENHFLDQIPE